MERPHEPYCLGKDLRHVAGPCAPPITLETRDVPCWQCGVIVHRHTPGLVPGHSFRFPPGIEPHVYPHNAEVTCPGCYPSPNPELCPQCRVNVANPSGTFCDPRARKALEKENPIPRLLEGKETVSLDLTLNPLDMVNHPQHYGGEGHPHEHYRCMIGTGLVRNGFLYNATKYIWRFGKKGTQADFLRDLNKAAWYLQKAIEQLDQGNAPGYNGSSRRLRDSESLGPHHEKCMDREDDHEVCFWELQ